MPQIVAINHLKIRYRQTAVAYIQMIVVFLFSLKFLLLALFHVFKLLLCHLAWFLMGDVEVKIQV